MREPLGWMVATQRVITAISATAIAIVCMSSSHAQEPSPLKRFQSEAPLAWSEFIALASCVEGEASSTKTDRITGKTLLEEGPSPFRINGHLAYRSIGKGTMILCQNQDYEFVVGDKNAGQWGLKQLLWNDRQGNEVAIQPYCDPSDGTLEHLPWQIALAYACRGIIIYTTWLPHLATSSTFKVIDATKVQSEESARALVRIKFTNEAKRGRGMNIESGEITMDPKRFWQIVEARIMAHEGHEGPGQLDCLLEINNEFQVADQLMPYAARQTMRLQSLPVVDFEDVCETKVFLRDKQDVRPFTLSAFGLPEPVKDPQKSALIGKKEDISDFLSSVGQGGVE